MDKFGNFKNIGKPFDLNHANKLIKRMNEKNIFSQACFILGYLNENKKDLNDTKKLIFNLTKNLFRKKFYANNLLEQRLYDIYVRFKLNRKKIITKFLSTNQL